MNFYILQGPYANQDDQSENLKIHQSLILNFLNKKVENLKVQQLHKFFDLNQIQVVKHLHFRMQ